MQKKPLSLTEVRKLVVKARLTRSNSEFLESELSEKVREYRAAVGMTLAQLAEKLGISLVYLSEIERGAKPWTDALLQKLEEVTQ
jgi:ribosome-binding protein aMBF1 (putative translation factor)